MTAKSLLQGMFFRPLRLFFRVLGQMLTHYSMSNGGGFIGTLACDSLGSALFTAFASHSGAFYTDVNGPRNCSPSKPSIPLLEIHGAADKTVRYAGGQGDGGPQPPISDWYASYPKPAHTLSPS